MFDNAKLTPSMPFAMSESPSPADLDNEIGVPLDATLEIPPQIRKPVQLLLIPTKGTPSVVTLASPCSPSGDDDEKLPGCLFAYVSSRSSMRGNAARSLVVGRQASAADVRVDHKSVSRRHTALYYNNIQGEDKALVVRDLGGKHGTHVDNCRLEKNGSVELHLGKRKEHTIRFGNAPMICRVIIPASKLNNSGQPSQPQHLNATKEQKRQMQQPETSANGPQKEPEKDTNMDTDDVASTRESREAQIAAMIASFDSNPVYKKYIPAEEENADIASMNIGATSLERNSSNNGNKNMHNNSKSNNKYNLPITSSITLSPGSNSFTSSDGTDTLLQANASVSTLCFEPSGARVAAGHRDGTLRLYDFHGMQPSASSSPNLGVTYPPFRIVDSDNDPLDSTGRHIITALGVSSTGSQWIVGSTSAQPKVLDREGRATLFYFIKGDTYVTDSSKTKGHTAGVTGVAFHPLVKDVCWTTGLDGSIRQWDVSGRAKTQFNKVVCQKVVGKCKNEKGQRTQVVSNLSVHPNGRKIAVGTSCGSVQIWNCFGMGVNSRPLGAVHAAHGAGNKPVTFVTFNGSGDRIASRSEGDNTVRVWDVARMEKSTGSFGRKFGNRSKEGEHSPSLLLAICKGVPAFNESANCAFGPDGKMLCAGTSVDPRAMSSNACGAIKFYELPAEEKRAKAIKDGGSKSSSKNKATAVLDPIEEVDVAPNASVLIVQWHTKMNQIAVGMSNGVIRVLYDQEVSTKGALIPASKTVRQSDGLSDLLRSRAPTGSAAYLGSSNSNIIVPNALPLFREEPRATRKTKERDRKDPEKTKLPEPPVTGGIKTGGNMGGGINFTQYIVESTNYVNNKNIAGKDPREELFKYNEGKKYVAQAYEGDVQRILAEKTVEEEEADLKSRKRPKTK